MQDSNYTNDSNDDGNNNEITIEEPSVNNHQFSSIMENINEQSSILFDNEQSSANINEIYYCYFSPSNTDEINIEQS